MYRYQSGNDGYIFYEIYSTSTGTWYILESRWISLETTNKVLCYINDELVRTVTENDGLVSSWTSGGVGVRSYHFSSTDYGYYDWFLVRKCVDPEPGHGDWGSEETLNDPPNAPTLNSPSANSRFDIGESVTFTWTFNDPNSGDSQSAYRFQLDDNSDFSSPIIDTGKVSSSTESTTQTLPSTIGKYYWRVKTWDSQDAEGPWSSGRAIIADRIYVYSMSVSDSRTNVGEGERVYVWLRFEYDNSYVTSGSFSVNGYSLSHVSDDKWQTGLISKSSVTKVTFNSVAGSCGNINNVNQNGKSTSIIWDRIYVYSSSVSDDRADVGSSVDVQVTLRYDYDEASVTTGSFSINGISATHIGSGVWKITVSQTSVTSVTYDSVSGQDGTYGISTIYQNGWSQTVIWDRIKIYEKDDPIIDKERNYKQTSHGTTKHSTFFEQPQNWYNFTSSLPMPLLFFCLAIAFIDKRLKLLSRRSREYSALIFVLFFVTFCIFTILSQEPVVKANPGWLSGWDKRVKIIIDHNDIDSDLTDFPVLIYLSSSSGRNNDDVSFVFDELQHDDNNRKKIAVTTSDGVTQCYVEIEKWDSANEEAWLWVKVPSVSSTTDTVLYLYYDKDHADNTDYVGDIDSVPAQNVWDSHFKGVWHLTEDASGTGTTDLYRDSTGNNNDGDDYISASGKSGKIDGGQEFDSTTDDRIEVSDSASLDITPNITIEAWVRWDSVTDYHTIVGKRDASSAEPLANYALRSNGDKIEFYHSYGSSWSIRTTDSVLSAGVWYYVVATKASGELAKIYLNGVEQTCSGGATNDLETNNVPLTIGAIYESSQEFDGIIDEVRISDIVRSAAWIKATYETTRDDLVCFGNEEVSSAAWLPGWNKRIKITIDSSDINEGLSNFPILIYLSSSSGINDDDVTCVFAEVGSNSKKIAITQADGITQLFVEIEKWNYTGTASTSKAWLWTKVPTINSGSDLELYLYYDSSQADNIDYVGDPESAPAQNVWDSNFVMVQHMNDYDTSHIHDSTSNDNDGTKSGEGSPAATDNGKIGDAQDFDGSNYINCGQDPSLDVDYITVEAWVKFDATDSSNRVIASIDDGTNRRWALYWKYDTQVLRFFVFVNNDWASPDYSWTPTIGTWYYLVGVKDASYVREYIDGSEVGTPASLSGVIDKDPADLMIGRGSYASPYFDGIIDELRISKVARSAAWIKATYETGRDDLLDFGNEEVNYDNTPPTYSDVSHNQTVAGEPCLFSCKWSDNVGLSGFIFSWNASGVWQNDTWTSLSGTSAWANVTKTLPNTVGLVIGYRWYCNDTSTNPQNNWNSTPIYTLTTTYSNPPQYSNVGHNTTLATKPVLFYCKWTDDQELSGYIFGTNITGAWQNDTWTALSGTSAWANETRTLPSDVGVVIAYQWWCNDSQGQWSTTGIQYLTITNPDAPTYSDISTNTTVAGAVCMFSCKWQDNIELSGYIFSHNMSGSWQNLTWTSLSGAVDWANVTLTLPDTPHIYVAFKWYCNDTGNNWAVSSQQTIYLTSQKSASVPAGTYVIIWFKAQYEYDGSAFTDAGGSILYINGTAATYDSEAGYWWINVTQTEPGNYTYVVSSVSDGIYGLTVINDVVGGVTIEWYSPNNAPTIGEFQAPSIVYANSYFYLNVTINDADGVADFNYATVEISYSIILKWENSTDTFSESSDSNGYCTLDAEGSLKISLNSTAYRLCWRIKLDWSYPEGYVSIISTNTKIYDCETSSSNSQADLFYFEDDLIVYSASVSDNRINPSESITFTGTLYYEGTTTPPADITGITVKLSLNNEEKASTTMINPDGTFQFTINGESSIGSYNYLIYALTDQPSVQNQTVNVKVDGLKIVNLQAVEYLGSGAYRYKAQIVYGVDNSAISGATVAVELPNGTKIAETTSNVTGWFSFVLGQLNATLSGTYRIYGVNDGVYGITYKLQNATFTLYAWTLQTVDLEGNTVSATTITIEKDGQDVWSGNPSTIRVPPATYSLNVTWLQNLKVHSSTITVSANKTSSLQCTLYPFSLNNQIWHVGSNATISNVTFTNRVLTVEFADSEANYILVVSCTQKPTYIYNYTYKLSDIFGGYLVIPHHANFTFKIFYKDWGIHIAETSNGRIIDMTLEDQILTITSQGEPGQVATLKLYCGSKGNPVETEGFTTTSYSSSTKILTGTYTFASQKILKLKWQVSGGGGGGTSGTATIGTLIVTVKTILASPIEAGTATTAKREIRWSGQTTIMIENIEFKEHPDWFKPPAMPIKITMSPSQDQGIYTLNVEVQVPDTAEPGQYSIPCEVTVSTPQGARTIVSSYATFTVTGATYGVPDIMTYIFLGVIGMIVVGAAFRETKKRKYFK